MSVKITTKLPSDEHNGLAALEAVWEENAFAEVWAVCRLHLSRRTADFDRKDDPTILAVRFASIEPMVAASKDETMVRNAAKRGFKNRTGLDTLPGIDEDPEPDEPNE
jgi:hypothetical protein